MSGGREPLFAALFVGMKKKKDTSGRSRGRILRRILLVVALLLLGTIVAGVSVVAYVAVTLDSDEDMAIMEAMRGSRTTRIWAPERKGDHASIDPTNYSPIEYDILYGDENMVWADGSEIPELLRNAFVAIEDQRFYKHHGVDWRRTGKAALNYIFRFEPQFGGSTITQQLIKNVHGEKDISAMRKLKEIIRARRLEKEYSKDEILTYYLNIVPLGHQCTGVKSAARYYFGKTLAELTPIECATLAAITNAPAYYEPEGHAEQNATRRNLVLNAMRQNGYLDVEAYETARDATLTLNVTDPVYSKRSRGWYTETVAADVISDLVSELGLTKSAATALVYRGGLDIYALVDPTVQTVMEKYFSNDANFTVDGKRIQGGMVICDPVTGDLLGVVGGVGEKQGSLLFNRATDGYYQPGSTLKPVALYGPALERDLITYSTVFEDLPELTETGGIWPHNSPGVYQGRITAAEALARSKNTVAVRIYRLLGRTEIFRYLRDTVGLKGLVRDENGKTDLGASPLALGQLTRGVTVREMAGAYTAFAGGGEQASTRSYAAVFDSHGELLLRKDAEKKRVMSEETAYILSEMLAGVVDHGTAHRITLDELVATAGKTGTSGDDKDKWFVGYTPSYVAGIRIGYDQPEPLPAGTVVHLTAWDAILHELYRREDLPGEETSFTAPAGIRQCEYCLDSGLVPTDACRSELRGDRVAVGLYKASHIPLGDCDVHTTAHYDILTEKYALGEGNPETSLDFHVLYLPSRIVPEGITPLDAEYEYSQIVRQQDEQREEPSGDSPA